MVNISWLSGLLFTAFLGTGLGIGYLLALVTTGRKTANLEAQLEQAEANLNLATSSQETTANKISQLSNQLHQQEIELSKLETLLAQEKTNQQRLNDEIAEHKTQLQTSQQNLEEVRQQQHASERQLETALANNQALSKQAADLESRLTASLEEHKQLQEAYQQLSNEHTELKTSLASKEEHFAQQVQQLNDNKQTLTKEFENLAHKIFEEKGKTFTNTSQASLDALLKPFKEQIAGFQKRINEVHDASLQGNTSLAAEIKKVLDVGLKMSQDASNLTTALKGDSQQRGAWGEAQLRRTLEMSGLIEEAHYEAQTSFKDAEGKTKQTDYLIKLPDGKHLVIDSKITLNAYDKAISANSPEEYQLAMDEHAKAVRKHIDDLASKDYTNLIGMHSPSFVLMFMPIEPAYIEALKNNKDLFEYGYKKGVVLVSHTTLIPILRTVSNLWMLERSNKEAREISESAGDIYNSVRLVAERLNRLGGSLNAASNHYNSTVTALAGQQGLYGKVNRFDQLSTRVNKSLPQLEPAHLDYETERLNLIIEPLEEEAANEG